MEFIYIPLTIAELNPRSGGVHGESYPDYTKHEKRTERHEGKATNAQSKRQALADLLAWELI